MFSTTTTTTTILRRLGAPLAVAALALSACGGSDDGDAASAPRSDDSGDAGDDPSGDGSNDEAQQNFDDLGVDIDLDELEDSISDMSMGDGGGNVTVNGVSYDFAAQVCIAQGPSFMAEGLAEGPDGTPAWVSIGYSKDFDFDGDGENDETLDIFVEVGRTEMFGSGGDDQPDWAASKINGGTLVTGDEISFEFSGNSISGSGPMNDYNFVALQPGETADMTFEATCS